MINSLMQERNAMFSDLFESNGNGLSEQYPRFADVMEQWGYDWEAHKVHTDDKYILTTFHILGRTGEPRADTYATVLCNHGIN